MAKVEIYTWTVCPYCVRAKRLLKEKGVEFEEINLDGKDDKFAELQKKSGMKTVPQIFINGKLVGGFQELSTANSSGELDKLLEG